MALTALTALAADKPKDQLDYLAESLQKGDAASAVALFGPQMKDFTAIKRAIESLTSLAGTTCTIEVDNAETSSPTIDLNTKWTLQLTSSENGPTVIRTEQVAISMRQTAGEWKIVSLSPLRVLARPDDAVFTRIAALAASLGGNDGPGAAALFDSAASQYGEISNDIDALVSQNDVLCAIDVVADNETAGIHELDTDWYLQLKSHADSGPTERRRERVELQMQFIKAKWRITKITPRDILSPVRIK